MILVKCDICGVVDEKVGDTFEWTITPKIFDLKIEIVWLADGKMMHTCPGCLLKFCVSMLTGLDSRDRIPLKVTAELINKEE